MNVYIIIKESGDYSAFISEIVACYNNLDQAKYAVELLEYRHSLEKELNSLTCTWSEQCDYIIREMHIDDLITYNESSMVKEKELILEEYKDKIEKAKIVKAHTEQLREEKNIEKKNERKKEVLEFWEWLHKGPDIDPYFNEKKQARIRAILPVMSKYLQEDIHSREMIDWFNNNRFKH